MSKLGFRLRYLHVFDYTLSPAYRCVHVNRFGIRCFRSWTYDQFCGLHNSVCWDTGRGHRHNWLGSGHH